MCEITLHVGQIVNTEQLPEGDNKDDDDDDDDDDDNHNNKCSRGSLVLTAQDNKCLQVTLVNSFQLLSNIMDEITHFLLNQVS
jgi:hypothetical protein